MQDKGLFRDTLHVIAQLLDYDEGIKLEHARNTAFLAYRFAKRLNYPHPQDAAYCAFLHDIGGIGVPDHILHHAMAGFPDPQARAHTTRGAEICSIFSLFARWQTVIADHHECYDGSGFPSGKRGAEISLLTGIVHLADQLDVLLRSCAPETLQETAIQEIQKASGTHVDPIIAKSAYQELQANGWIINIFKNESDILDVNFQNLPPPSFAADIHTEQDSQRATTQLLKLIAYIVDAKSPYTVGHSIRVARLAASVAQAMEPSISMIDTFWAGLLHDIGKVALPTALLHQKTPLLPEQWQLMRTHAMKSIEFIEKIGAFRHLALAAASHHERYGGGGYPLGLSGEAIPLIGRILAYADAYDAMTTPREYNVVLSHEKALDVLQKKAGTHFDPDLLPVVLHTFQNAPVITADSDIDSIGHIPPKKEKKETVVFQDIRNLPSTGELSQNVWTHIRISPTLEILENAESFFSIILNMRVHKLDEAINPADHPLLQECLHRASNAGHASCVLHSSHDLLLEMLAIKNQTDFDVFIRSAEKQFHSVSRLAMLYRNFSLDPNGLAFFTPDGAIFEINNAFAELIRASRETVLGRNIMGFLSPDLQRAVSHRHFENIESFLVRTDGFFVPVDASVVALTNAAGEISGFMLRAYDITLRKEIQAQLRRITEELTQRNRELETINRFKSELVAMTSHDLKSPLAGIIATARFLLDFPDTPPDKQKKSLSHIIQAGERLISFIQDLLDLERMETGKLTLEKHPVVLRDVVLETVESTEPAAAERGIRIETDLLPVLCMVYGEKRRLHQILHNLLSNAIKFSPDGGKIFVKLSCENNIARIQVKDEGPGIPDDQLETIFDRFHQAQNQTNPRNFSGAGLGLSIVRNLVQLHGGRVFASNSHGAIFTVELPLLQTSETRPVVWIQDPFNRLSSIVAMLQARDITVETLSPGVIPQTPPVLAAIIDGQALTSGMTSQLEKLSSYIPLAIVSKPQTTIPLSGVEIWEEPVLDTEVAEFLRAARIQWGKMVHVR